MQTALDIIDLFEASIDPCTISPRGYYNGKPLEKGGTSIQGKAAPGVRWLFGKGYIKTTDKVLDYGAGKYGRNGLYLREQGCDVFCYDPFNGSGKDGWNGVAATLPKERFDITFTSFVLNVIPIQIERDIVREVSSMSKKSFHITRNTDIFDSVKKALYRKDKLVGAFFKKHFATDLEKEQYKQEVLDDETIMEFCLFGVQTSRGFQRIPCLNDAQLLKSTSGYKIYQG
jgi:hypothetical protein